MIGEKLTQEVSNDILTLVMNKGFTVDKTIIRQWIFRKYKIKIYPQRFMDHYIGSITIDGKINNYLDENRKYIKSNDVEECFDKLVKFALKKIEELK